MKFCGKIMTRIYAAILVLLLFASTVSGNAIPVDGYAAQVGESVITVSQVLSALRPIEAQLRQSYSGLELQEQLEKAYDAILDSMIERQLIVNYFNQQGMTIPETVIDGRIDELVHQQFNKDKMALMSQLAEEGLTIDEWRNEIRSQIIASVMREREVDGKVAVSPGEIRDWYERHIDDYRRPAQVELRMIVFDSGIGDEEKEVKKRMASKIREQLVNGKSFEKMAMEVSVGTKASSGGYWGWVDPDSRRKELAEALKRLSPGDISEVIEAGNNLYILTVEGRKNEVIIPLEKAEAEIVDRMRSEKAEALYADWIERLKDRAYIRKFE